MISSLFVSFIALTSATTDSSSPFVLGTNQVTMNSIQKDFGPDVNKISVALSSAPTSNVLVYFESTDLTFDQCTQLTFTSLNWKVEQTVNAVVAQPVVFSEKDTTKSYSINFKSYSCDAKFNQKTQSYSFNKVTKACVTCIGVGDPHFKTLNAIDYDSTALGLYQMIDSDPLSVVLKTEKCHTNGQSCISQLFMRYGATRVTVDLITAQDKYEPVISGPKDSSVVLTSKPKDSKGKQMFKITFGSSYVEIRISRYNDKHKYLDVYFNLDANYEKYIKGGLCNIFTKKNVLFGKDKKEYTPKPQSQVDAFVTSWAGTDVNAMLGVDKAFVNFYPNTCKLPTTPPDLACSSSSSSSSSSSVVPITSSSSSTTTTSSSSSTSSPIVSSSSTTDSTSSATTTTTTTSSTMNVYETTSSTDSGPVTTTSTDGYMTTETSTSTTTSCSPTPETTDSSIYISSAQSFSLATAGMFGFVFYFVF